MPVKLLLVILLMNYSHWRSTTKGRIHSSKESNWFWVSLTLRIDWLEKADLFQTIQEKPDYYKYIQVSINTVVLCVAKEKFTSHASLSNFTSHKAQATWTFLTVLFDVLALDDINNLYIISDSPNSQYRIAYNVYFSWTFSEEKKSDLIRIFAESRHKKDPMDRVGS